ncbi:MAG: substrate-binding domain-containing protein [Halobacteriales archaeon]
MRRSRRSVVHGLALAAAGTAGAVGFAGFGAGRASNATTALVAGSLLELASDIPGASVEAHGSVAVRRLVLDGLREPDAVALADPRLFAGISERGTTFATNAVVLAYDPGSVHADAIASDWAAAIGNPDLSLGRTDPQKDPLGYRTVMALRLADRRYGVDADAALEGSSVFLETDLLNVLAGGQLDAAFAYRNMAEQRDLSYVELPDDVDFSNPAYADVYRTVSCDIGEQTVRGAPIAYAASALSEAGGPWVERLVTAGEALREAGFVVPAGYPRRDVRLAATT